MHLFHMLFCILFENMQCFAQYRPINTYIISHFTIPWSQTDPSWPLTYCPNSHWMGCSTGLILSHLPFSSHTLPCSVRTSPMAYIWLQTQGKCAARIYWELGNMCRVHLIPSSILLMVGQAKSEAKKKQEGAEEKAELQRIAVEHYCQELQKGDGKIRGARNICEEVEIEHKNKTGHYIHLNHATIIRHANGGKPMAKFNAKKCLLSKEEEEVILGFAEETANWGFPLSHRWLCEHTDLIIKARNPSFKGVGNNWTDRFVLYHSERIKTIWSSSLEGARAQSANPTNNKEWYDLLAKHIKDTNPDCIWAADETGIQTGTAVKEQVIRAKGKTTQHQTREGNQENITMIVTICADGSSIAPAIIFKGQAFLAGWQQHNPLGAS